MSDNMVTFNGVQGGEWRCCGSNMDWCVRLGSLVPLQPVEGVEYEGGDGYRRRWVGGRWHVLVCGGPVADSDHLWRTGQLRPVQSQPWTPTVDEWVQHKTEPWDKARKVAAVVLDRVRLGNTCWVSLDCVRPATPEEITAAKRIELVDRLIVRCKADGGVWQYRFYGGVHGYWKKLSDNGCERPTLDLDHCDILPEYTVQGARR